MRGPGSIARAGLDADRPALGLPRLPLTEQLLTAAIAVPAAGVHTALPRVIASSSVTIPMLPPWPQRLLGLAFALLRWCVVFAVLRFGRQLQKQSLRLVTERDAAVEGSRFAEVAPGVTLHYVMEPPSNQEEDSSMRDGRRPLLLHFAHGFGANALTWDPFFAELRTTMARVAPTRAAWLAAHDRLGFGLTPRPRQVELYSQDAGASFALRLLEALAAVIRDSAQAAEAATPLSPLAESSDATDATEAWSPSSSDDDDPLQPLPPSSSPKSVVPRRPAPEPAAKGFEDLSSRIGGAPNAPPASATSPAASHDTVFVGHSLGGALSARMLTKSPTPPKAVVLIAPALIAPSAMSAAATTAASSPSATASKVARLAKGALALPSRFVSRVVAAITLAYLRVVVSCLIFSATFWRNGLAAAYYDATKLTDAMVVRYRWPAQVRGAARGVASFSLAVLQGGLAEAAARLAPPRRAAQALARIHI